MATIPSETPGLLPDLPETLNFSKMEEAVLAYWTQIDAFQTSLKKSEGRPAWSFYDGPPFATGMPHYGHILAGTIKDVVCRYAHQTGHHVERRFGWDCHGLPIEFEIEKELGIKSSHDVQKMGIAAYNQACRGIVMRYATEWERIITRSGRWIDFKNDYKTLNLSYMESVWWVFKQLWEKKLVYRGFKVMPYSTGCTTPLSNFEANMNYKDVPDPSVMVTFPIVGDADGAAMLAWTTTPWTLPSNLGLTVNAGFDYLRVRDTKTNNVLIFAECRLDEVYKNHAKAEVKPFTVLGKCKGADLVGLKYVPLFPYFQEKMGATAFRVVADNYVSADSGTGVVHSAPGFGEDDYRVCVANGIITKDGGIVCPVDENGCYTAEVTDFAGKHVKESDAAVMDMIKANGRLFSKGTIIHSYPYCWRSETPLIYKAVESWFINVEGMRDRLLKNVNETTWVPEFVQTRRFQNWLEDARDWNVSRNRYFGTPLPVWHSADWEEIICVGSVAELEQLSGVSGITDLHRESVDNITIPSKREGVAPLKRIAPVFDCWFESGSMPYAQSHYPFAFSDPKAFETRFPADFIAEGLDQTRGWFYTMLVLGTALFDKAPFKNVIVNGLVLAADGSKMSKSKKNYPPVEDILNTCGADALRLFLINSPVVRAEPLRFREEGVKEVVRDVFLPLVNAFKFFVQNANARLRRGKHDLSLDAAPSTNVMDIWIVAATQTLVGYFHDEMKGYRLYTVLPGVMRFLEVLTNWYVRMNRRRLKGYGSTAEDEADQVAALNTLLYVLFAAVRVLAPLTPFLAETLYQLIKPVLPADQQEDSIHYLMLPAKDASRLDVNVERSMNRLMAIIELVRVMRDRKNYPMKKPIKDVVVIHSNPEYVSDVRALGHYFQGEINALNVTYTSDEGDYVVRKVEANMAALGKRLKKEAGAISAALKKFTPQETAAFLASGTAVVMGQTITMEDVKVTHTFREGIENYATNTDNDVLVLMTTEMDEAMVDMWRAREFVSAVQKLRKKAGLVITDKVQVQLTTEHDEVVQSLTNAAATISATVPEGSWSVSKAGAAAAAAAAPSEPIIESDADAEVGALSVKIQLFRA